MRNSNFAKNRANRTACTVQKANTEQNNRLNPFAFFSYPNGVVAKSTAECDNSNINTANSSTPLNRAVFVCSLHIPKERYFVACSSMVACSGQPLAVGCVPCIAVCHPVARYRPITVTSEAIARINFYTELSAMIYKFLLLGEKRLTIRIFANSEQEARQRLGLTSPALCVARLGGIYA